MFKLPKKNSLSQPTTFWRYSLILFGLGLIVVFVGQTVLLFIMGEITSPSADSLSSVPPAETLDSKLVNDLFAEVKDRPLRSAEILATTTIFVDPSL